MQFKEIRIGNRVKNKIVGGKQVFSSKEIKNINAKVGEIVKLVNKDFIAYASINPINPLRYIRVLWIGEKFDMYEVLYKKIKEAYNYRKILGLKDTFRLVYSESDFISGLIIDKFSDIFVIQNSNPFLDKNMDILKDVLIEIFGSSINIYEKSIGKSRDFERLPPREELIYGENTTTIISENKRRFYVDVKNGEKTGWFLDQRENREFVSNIAYGDVLDVFSYTGGFGIEVDNYNTITFVEKNKSAIELLKKNIELNNIENYKIIKGNAFSVLKEFAREKRKFDTIILDPPDLLQEGIRKGWKSLLLINSIALDLIKDNGLFITFSCSENVNESKFYKALVSIMRRKNKIPILIKRLYQSRDHPIIYAHKELSYLKGFVFRIVDQKRFNIKFK